MTYKIRLRKKKDVEDIQIQDAKYLEGYNHTRDDLEEILSDIDEKEIWHLGDGTYKSVYELDEMVCKVAKGHGDPIKNHESQVALREEFDFFPEYYGTVISEGKYISFYEKIGKMRKRDWDIGKIGQAYEIVTTAIDKGYAIDWKHSNFGQKDGQIVYIDEGGVGKGTLPPDVVDGFENFSNDFQNGMRSIPQKTWDQIKKVGRVKGIFSKLRLKKPTEVDGMWSED